MLRPVRSIAAMVGQVGARMVGSAVGRVAGGVAGEGMRDVTRPAIITLHRGWGGPSKSTYKRKYPAKNVSEHWEIASV